MRPAAAAATALDRWRQSMNAPNLLATDKRPRLLLVDDDPTNLHVLRQILGEDYRLSFATDGRKALQLAQHQPDLILLDIMMPELDGYAVCRQLKAQEIGRASCRERV